MSRAAQLMHRLERLGQPVVNEQTPEEDSDDENNGEKPEEERDMEGDSPEMAEPDSPFSNRVRNPDGSIRLGQDDQMINDKGRFVVRRKR